MLTDKELQTLRNIGNEAEAAADEIEHLRGALERAADVARNACEGWNDALMHEGANMAGEAVRQLLTPNASNEGPALATVPLD